MIYADTILIEYNVSFRDNNEFSNFIQELLLTKDEYKICLKFEVIAYSNDFINCKFKLTSKEEEKFVIALVDKYSKEYN